VPPDVTVWRLLDFFHDLPGFEAAAVSLPSRTAPFRELRVRFKSAAEAQSSFAAWPEARLAMGLEQLSTMHLEQLSPRPDVEAFVVPPEMSHPEQIKRDAAFSARAIRLLDALMGIPAEATEELLSRDGSNEIKLDLQVLYLRRVHHFCFYAATWHEDEWVLRACCGSAVLRPALEEGDEARGGLWAEAHERRLEAFLAKAHLNRPTVPSIDDDPLRELCAKVGEESARQVAENKFMCVHCRKHFKGPSYVAKHVRKMHAEVLHRLRQKALADAARADFLADKSAPDFNSFLAILQQGALTAAQQGGTAVTEDVASKATQQGDCAPAR